MATRYLHINYIPENGWVLSIMTRLLNSTDPQLRKAFDDWSDTPLMELGYAVTTRMHMLGLSIRRLNRRVSSLRDELNADLSQVDWCLEKNGAFTLKDQELPYELLLDMDSFIFETRSLYEIVGKKFLVHLFRALFGTVVTEADLQARLSANDIDTRWIEELRENRKLFFHETAPWLAVSIRDGMKFAPILLKRSVQTFDDPDSLVEFDRLREIYNGFVESVTELHRYVLEQIRLREEATAA